MDAVRVPGRFRFAPLIEWMIAAAFLFATVAVASLVVRELRGPTRILAETPAARPLVASMPRRGAAARGVGAGAAVPRRQGDPRRRRPPRPSRPTSDAPPRAAARKSIAGTLGERLTRFYEYSGSKFIVVFEPFERNGEPRVAAIYLP